MGATEPIRSANWVPNHVAVYGRYHRLWRGVAYNALARAGIPPGRSRLRVAVELHFPVRRQRDAPNYHTHVIKPIIDALGPQRIVRTKTGKRVELGLGIIPNDTADHLDLLAPTIANQPCDRSLYPHGYVELTITDLSGE